MIKPAAAVKSFLLPEYNRVIRQELSRYNHRKMAHPSPSLAWDFAMRWQEWVSESVDTSMFPYAYVGGNGSSELLKALAHNIVGRYGRSISYIFNLKGEFEGWGKFVELAHGETRELDDATKFEGMNAYLTNPSSINGNWGFESQPNEYNAFMEHNHVFMDMAYIGTTAPKIVHVGDAEAVVFSCSKSLGMFPWRLGLMFTKFEMPELEYNNKFLFPVMATYLAMRLMYEFPLDYAYQHMRVYQQAAVEYFNENSLCKMEPSDSYLLAWGINEKIVEVGPEYARGDYYNRFCLTPYYERMLYGEGDSL